MIVHLCTHTHTHTHTRTHAHTHAHTHVCNVRILNTYWLTVFIKQDYASADHSILIRSCSIQLILDVWIQSWSQRYKIWGHGGHNYNGTAS